MSLAHLPSSWREWLALNIERGCARADLLRSMEQGGIDPDIARVALHEMAVDSTADQVLLPQIDLAEACVLFEMTSPRIALIDGLLDVEECAALITLGRSSLRASAVVDNDTGHVVQHPARSGTLSFLQPGSPLIDRIEARISKLLQWPLDCFEHLQAIGYGPEDEYRAHHDCFDENSDGAARHLQRGGQRVGTLLMYLQEPSRGGDTSFPQLGQLKVKPRRGAALWFQNVRSDGQPDPRLLHAGEPVAAGQKWVCTAWLRQQCWRRAYTAGDVR